MVTLVNHTEIYSHFKGLLVFEKQHKQKELYVAAVSVFLFTAERTSCHLYDNVLQHQPTDLC